MAKLWGDNITQKNICDHIYFAARVNITYIIIYNVNFVRPMQLHILKPVTPSHRSLEE